MLVMRFAHIRDSLHMRAGWSISQPTHPEGRWQGAVPTGSPPVQSSGRSDRQMTAWMSGAGRLQRGCLK